LGDDAQTSIITRSYRGAEARESAETTVRLVASDRIQSAHLHYPGGACATKKIACAVVILGLGSCTKTPGGPSQDTQGTLSFSATASRGWSSITVTVDGRTIGTLSSFVTPTSSSVCTASTGRAVATVDGGTAHSYSATSNSGAAWSGTVTVNPGYCLETYLNCPNGDCSGGASGQCSTTSLQSTTQQAQQACLNDPAWGPTPGGGFAPGTACLNADIAVRNALQSYCACLNKTVVKGDNPAYKGVLALSPSNYPRLCE
jgi:hypothetical protein